MQIQKKIDTLFKEIEDDYEKNPGKLFDEDTFLSRMCMGNIITKRLTK